MKIVGEIDLNVFIKGTCKKQAHEFQVVDTTSCTGILLGEDFIELFRSMTFNF